MQSVTGQNSNREHALPLQCSYSTRTITKSLVPKSLGQLWIIQTNQGWPHGDTLTCVYKGSINNKMANIWAGCQPTTISDEGAK